MEKKIRKENFSLSLRAQWREWYEYYLEYLLGTSVSTSRLVEY